MPIFKEKIALFGELCMCNFRTVQSMIMTRVSQLRLQIFHQTVIVFEGHIIAFLIQYLKMLGVLVDALCIALVIGP